MSQTISIANKPEGDGLASHSQSHKPEGDACLPVRQAGLPVRQAGPPVRQAGLPVRQAGLPARQGLASQSHKPKIADNVTWRLDGENDQIVIVHKEDLPLPMILNVTASKIFSLCNGNNSVKDIARLIREEFSGVDFLKVLEDVKYQVSCFLEKGIVE